MNSSDRFRRPTVHDLQFGTYTSPHASRGRHSGWPCMCGLTRSHGRRAGGWLRLGDRSYWACLDRPHRRVRTVDTPWAPGVGAPVYRRPPAGLPPVNTGPLGYLGAGLLLRIGLLGVAVTLTGVGIAAWLR